jgi:ABC-type bacteriocin/lantibiotic exporter with double-glycine peptidase domain
MNTPLPLSPIKRFFNLLKVDKQDIMSIYIYALFNGIVALSLPLGIQAIINLITGGQVSTSWIVLVIFVIGGVVFTGVMQIMQLTITENLQQKIFTRSAFEFAYRIPRLQLEAIDKAYTPELVNRFFDTISVQKGLSKILIDFSSASLQAVFGLILLSIYHPFFILFSLLLIILVYIIFKLTALKGLQTSLKESKYKYEVAHWLEELARAMETFKLAGDSKLPLQKTDDAVENYLYARRNHFKTLRFQYINLVVFKAIIVAGLLFIGGLLVINQQMNIGQFVAAEIIIILVLASVEKLILSMETIYDVLTSIEKIGNVTDIPLDSDGNKRMNLEDEEGISITLNKVYYGFYDSDEHLLKNINLQIKKGEKICISGFNGSGKSLLIQLIAGLYEGFSGSISYNGVSLGSWVKEDLHKHIGDNLSSEDIFKGSLEENISLGKESISFEDIQKAIEIVGLSEYVSSLAKGLSTELIPEGKNLAKSVRRKIMLARSIVSKPKLILLSDHFNQLKPSDLKSFVDYLINTKATVIAVSNNPEIAKLFDRTVILDNGEIVAADKMQALLKFKSFSSLFNSK